MLHPPALRTADGVLPTALQSTGGVLHALGLQGTGRLLYAYGLLPQERLLSRRLLAPALLYVQRDRVLRARLLHL